MNICGIEFDTCWMHDCSGKMDFDFPVVRVSSRFWPDNTAKCTIYLGNDVVLAQSDGYISGDTPEECKYKVEQFVRQEVSKIITSLHANEDKKQGFFERFIKGGR